MRSLKIIPRTNELDDLLHLIMLILVVTSECTCLGYMTWRRDLLLFLGSACRPNLSISGQAC